MPVIQLAHNAVTAKLINASREAKLVVSSLLSYRVEGAEHTPGFSSSGWDGRSSFFDFRAGTFPAGFVHRVHAELTQRGHTVKLVRKPFPAPLGAADPVVDSFPPNSLYNYQPETINRLLKYGQMIAQVATGGGKSRVAKLAYARIARPTLFLTTRSVLMHQMKDAFERDMGIACGVIGEGQWNPCRGMNVAMVQTIAPYVTPKTIEGEVERLLTAQANAEAKAIDDTKKALKKKRANLKEMNEELAKVRKTLVARRQSDKLLASKAKAAVERHNTQHKKVIKLLEFFEFVILEEAHEAGGNGFYEILRRCKNAHYRLSLTATPFMRQDEESNMRLMACSGEVGIRITEKLLIDRGILARPYFKYVKADKPPKLFRSTSWQRAYKIGVVENQSRNKAVVKEVYRASRLGLTSMVLVQHTAHGKLLKKMLDAVGVRAAFIYGKHEQDQRKDALAKLADGEIDCLIGSTILDVGVDVPAVGLVVLAGGGKAEVALRQRIGRGLRRKKVGPNVCLVVDFCDEHNSTLKSHAAQRRAIVEATPGFAENILPDGADFDLEALGFLK